MKKLVFSQQIVNKEKITTRDMVDILGVCMKNIFQRIKGDNLPTNASLVKIYVTTISGARRLVILFDESIQVGHFLFYRKKNDPIGKNISIKNPQFKKELTKYLKIWSEDIENDNFKVISL